MAKYLLLKHYRGGPAPVVDIDLMDRWTPAEIDAHVQYIPPASSSCPVGGSAPSGPPVATDGRWSIPYRCARSSINGSGGVLRVRLPLALHAQRRA
jgi:hypothetical protein